MRIYTWNVNSVKARFDRLMNWLEVNQPDVLCLQELKAIDDDFPYEEVSQLGYFAAVHGQATYNGVAILSRSPQDDVVRNMDDGVDDDQSRLIAATIDGVRVVCVYVPNGGNLGSDKWDYKLAWYARLRSWLKARCDPAQKVVLCGDFNVAPDARDVAKPEAWGDSVLCVPEARAALQRVVDWGFVDTLRQHTDAPEIYSWWDYRRMGFQRGDGLRIDMVYASAPMAAACTGFFVDREERKRPRPSDHCPVGADFNV